MHLFHRGENVFADAVEVMLNKGEKMELTELLYSECMIVPLVAQSRDAAITELINACATAGYVDDPEVLHESVFHRENMRSTLAFHGIAIPRGSSKGTRVPVLAIGLCSEVMLWDEANHHHVSIVMLYAWPNPRNVTFLKTLIQLARVLHDINKREKLMSAVDSADLYNKAVEALT
jgi:mannitol/fructose-specific phosphotransferase system IIA component (Ntr-type)